MASDYATYVFERYQGEDFGEATMAAAAEACGDPAIVRKLRVLEQLERETGELLLPEVKATGGSPEPDPERTRQGQAVGSQMGAVPLQDFAKAMATEVAKLVPVFEEAEALAPPGKEALLRHVTDHERALLAFAEAELAGRGDESLDPVLALLRDEPT